jgi:hypothetical protein
MCGSWLPPLTVAIALGIAALMPSALRAQSPCPNPAPVTIAPPNLNAPSATLVPLDVCTPSQVPGGNPIAYFDDYSWKAFIALVWPAMSGQRGIPDPAQSLSKADATLVFETYKADWETFQPNGARPTPWNETAAASIPCSNAKPGDFVLSSFTKFGNIGEAGIGNLVSVLVAQNGTFVRYLAAYNEVEFTAIRSNNWYLAANLPDNQPSPANPITFSSGSLNVKSSWIDMTNIPHPERYHTRMAWLQDPISGACSSTPVMVGLVGLHIVQKTPSRPQWIWSTFEHVDNVPPSDYAPPQPPAKPTRTFAFNDGTATKMPDDLPDEYTWSEAIKKIPPPINIERLTPINNDSTVSRNTVATNKIWQNALSQQNSVWQFYQLTMTQWPTAVPPDPKLAGTPGNTFPGTGATSAFANTTLETWDQTAIRSGCMNCHTQTQSNDFVWSLTMQAFKASPPMIALARRDRTVSGSSLALDALKDILAAQRKH